VLPHWTNQRPTDYCHFSFCCCCCCCRCDRPDSRRKWRDICWSPPTGNIRLALVSIKSIEIKSHELVCIANAINTATDDRQHDRRLHANLTAVMRHYRNYSTLSRGMPHEVISFSPFISVSFMRDTIETMCSNVNDMDPRPAALQRIMTVIRHTRHYGL